VTVVVSSGNGGMVFQGTLPLDGSGRGQIPALSPGTYVVTAHVTGYAPRSFSTTLPASQLDVALDHGGSVELRCCNGQAFRRIRLLDSRGIAQLVPASTIGGWTDLSDPGALWPNVAEGRYTLEVSGGDRLELTVKTDSRTVVELR
jgi:hypothetical protein